MDYAVDMGINFFDTAEMYAVPPKPDTQGSTEEIIGTWFKKTGKRDEIILATKVSGRAPFDWLRDDGSKTEHSRCRLWKPLIKVWRACKPIMSTSISCIGPTARWPCLAAAFGYKHLSDQINRIEDILGVLADIQKAGKVRHFGLSNETPWGIMKFLQHAELNKDLPRIVSVQNAYNLVNRIYELGSSEIYHHEGVGLLAIRRWRKAI